LKVIMDARVKPGHDAAYVVPRAWRRFLSLFSFQTANFKQPTLRRPYSLAGAGYALIPLAPHANEGDGAPKGATF
jgi:hypothetical protein